MKRMRFLPFLLLATALSATSPGAQNDEGTPGQTPAEGAGAGIVSPTPAPPGPAATTDTGTPPQPAAQPGQKELVQKTLEADRNAARLQKQAEKDAKTIEERDRRIETLTLDLHASQTRAEVAQKEIREEAEAEVRKAHEALAAAEQRIEEAQKSEDSKRLAAKLQQSGKEVATLKAELASRNAASQEQTQQVERLTRELSDLRAGAAKARQEAPPASPPERQLDALLKKAAELQASVDEKNAALAANHTQVEKLTEELDAQRKAVQNTRDEAEQSRKQGEAQLQAAAKAQEDLRQELAQLKESKQEEQSHTLRRLKARTAELEKKLEGLEADLREKDHAAADKDRQIKDLTGKLQGAGEEAAAREEKARAEIRTELKAALHAQDELRQETEKLKQAAASVPPAADAGEKIQRLQASLAEQNAALTEKDHKIESLTQDVEKLTRATREASSDADVRNLAATLATREQELQELKTAHTQNIRTLESLRQKLTQAEEAVKRFKADADAKAEAILDRDEKIRDFDAELKKARRTAISVQEEALDKADSRVKQAAKAQEELEQQTAALKAARDEDAKKIEGMRQQIDAADKATQQLQAVIDEKDAELSRRDKQIRSAGEYGAVTNGATPPRMEKAEETERTLRKEIAALKDAAAQKARLTEALQARAGSLQEEAARMQATVADREAALSARVTETGVFIRQLADARSQVTNMVHELHQVAEARDRYSAAVEALQAQNRNSQTAISKLKEQVTEMEAQTAELHAALGDKTAIQNAIGQSVEEHEKLAKELAELQAENKKLSENGDRQKADLTDVTRMAAELKDTLSQKEKELAASRLESEEARKDLEEARRKASESEQTIAKLTENAGLKAALANAAEQQQEQATNQLAVVREIDRQSRETVASLMQRLNASNEELAKLKSAVADKDAALFSRDQQIEALRADARRREEMLAKPKIEAATAGTNAITPAALSDESRKLRAAHGRMASNYARLGMYREAEKEYLCLLQLNPSDADAHYNLGVLYDDKLKDQGMAAVHYREYLRLRPNAKDAAEVNEWLKRIEDRFEPSP